MTCEVPDCPNEARFNDGYCHKHHKRYVRHGSPYVVNSPRQYPEECCVEGCHRPHHSKGYCNYHYKQVRKGEQYG